jgi:hypothetical protein
LDLDEFAGCGKRLTAKASTEDDPFAIDDAMTVDRYR